MLTGGGTDDQCVKLVQGLRQLGHEAWIAGPEGREFSNHARGMGIPFADTGKEGPGKVALIWRVAKLIRSQGFSVFHAHHGRDYWPAVLAARLAGRGVRLVLTRHLAKSPSSWPSRHFLLGQCDAMLAVSEFVAKVMREGVFEPNSPERERHRRPAMHGDHGKIRVVYGGIDTSRFTPADAGDQRRQWGVAAGDYAFGVVGGYDLPRGKGQREFLAAASRIHQRVPHARFLIVGRGSMAEILQQDIARLGLEGKAWLTPYSTDMPKAMNALDCLVHPQVGTESFGLVLIEAYACGRPVIASALDGIPEAFAVGNYGQLVTSESVGELSEAMMRWAAQPPLDQTGRAALSSRVAERFSMLSAARRVEQVYGELLGRR